MKKLSLLILLELGMNGGTIHAGHNSESFLEKTVAGVKEAHLIPESVNWQTTKKVACFGVASAACIGLLGKSDTSIFGATTVGKIATTTGTALAVTGLAKFWNTHIEKEKTNREIIQESASEIKNIALENVVLGILFPVGISKMSSGWGYLKSFIWTPSPIITPIVTTPHIISYKNAATSIATKYTLKKTIHYTLEKFNLSDSHSGTLLIIDLSLSCLFGDTVKTIAKTPHLFNNLYPWAATIVAEGISRGTHNVIQGVIQKHSEQ